MFYTIYKSKKREGLNMKKIFKVIADINVLTKLKYELRIWEYDVVTETAQSFVLLSLDGEETRVFKNKLFTLKKTVHGIHGMHASLSCTEEDLEKTIEIVKEEVNTTIQKHQSYLEQILQLQQNGPTIVRKQVFVKPKTE